MKKHNYHIVIQVVTLIFALGTVIQIQINGTSEESVRWLIATTARVSAILFSFAFGISSVHYFVKEKWTRFLFILRPHVGLAFGVSHTFHLSFLIWLQSSIHPVFTLAKTTSLIGGGMAYVFIYLLMITTFPRVKTRMNRTYWKALHLIGAYWIWFIFAKTYFHKVMNQNEGLSLLVLLIIVIVMRQVHVYFKRRDQKKIV